MNSKGAPALFEPRRRAKAHLVILIALVLSSCEGSVGSFNKLTAHSYSPTELWDAMLNDPKQSGHALSQSGPSSFSYVQVKGVVSRIEPADNSSEPPALIFDVDRSSV